MNEFAEHWLEKSVQMEGSRALFVQMWCGMRYLKNVYGFGDNN